MLNHFVFAYLDDILIFSSSPEEHEQHVHQVLQCLLDNWLFVKAEKCKFHAPFVSFLGYILTEGEAMDSAKVKAVRDWPHPQSWKKLQSFLSFANFCRWLIRA